MKRISLVAALLGAIVLAFAGIAAADTTTTPGNSSVGGANAKGTQVFHYTANYDDPWFGSVSCIGVHQIKNKQPVQDSFTCTSTTGSQLTWGAPGQWVTPGLTLSFPNGTLPDWYSDYDGTHAKTLSGSISADGMSYSAVATY